MDISCAFPTTLDSPDHIKIAEDLGYHRAWLYDTPQQSPDVWMALGLAAARTERIGLGPGVLIPSLRHPMVNAAGTAGLVALAPGRVAVGFGTGFTGRRAMGYGSISWADTLRYVDAFVALLRGDTIVWEGATMRMLHPDGNAPARPIEVPIILSAFGPKGTELTRQRGYGLFAAPGTFPPGVFDWVTAITWGSVRGDDEPPHSSRELAAAGPGWAIHYHLAYEYGGPAAVEQMPGGDAWLAAVNEHHESERHLAIHANHLIGLNDADNAAWNSGGSAMLEQVTVTGTAAEVRSRVHQLGETGITEIAYQPAGPDVPGELGRFIDALQ
jgi:5,10-methylenetetrahydromethanopterin reductase